jgi:hypothetical protein
MPDVSDPRKPLCMPAFFLLRRVFFSRMLSPPQMQLFASGCLPQRNGACIRNPKKVNPAAIVFPILRRTPFASAIPLSLRARPFVVRRRAKRVQNAKNNQKRSMEPVRSAKKRDGIHRPVFGNRIFIF